MTVGPGYLGTRLPWYSDPGEKKNYERFRSQILFAVRRIMSDMCRSWAAGWLPGPRGRQFQWQNIIVLLSMALGSAFVCCPWTAAWNSVRQESSKLYTTFRSSHSLSHDVCNSFTCATQLQCLSVCLSVRPSVCHKPVLQRNVWATFAEVVCKYSQFLATCGQDIFWKADKHHTYRDAVQIVICRTAQFPIAMSVNDGYFHRLKRLCNFEYLQLYKIIEGQNKTNK